VLSCVVYGSVDRRRCEQRCPTNHERNSIALIKIDKTQPAPLGSLVASTPHGFLRREVDGLLVDVKICSYSSVHDLGGKSLGDVGHDSSHVSNSSCPIVVRDPKGRQSQQHQGRLSPEMGKNGSKQNFINIAARSEHDTCVEDEWSRLFLAWCDRNHRL